MAKAKKMGAHKKGYPMPKKMPTGKANMQYEAPDGSVAYPPTNQIYR